jgi:hypothetical protein
MSHGCGAGYSDSSRVEAGYALERKRRLAFCALASLTQLGCNRRHHAVGDCDVVAFGKAEFFEPSPKSTQTPFHCIGRSALEANNRRARSERPSNRTAEQREELPPPYSITSSARASSDVGTTMPSSLAVLPLITNSNFVGCNTGSSAGAVHRSMSASPRKRLNSGNLQGCCSCRRNDRSAAVDNAQPRPVGDDRTRFTKTL